MLEGKRIILGISGGIAAYKSATLIRLLQKAGAEVRVVVTKNALEFVTRVTLETLSRNKVYIELFGIDNDYATEHVSLTDWGDAFVVAPASANIIGKLANGIADDALSTSLLAFNRALFLAPSMNVKMYEHFAVKKNLEYLSGKGINIIEPTEGYLACGYEGQGRMEEPEKIVAYLEKYFLNTAKLAGKKALVTAGPTNEALDLVRFFGNNSTGLMGFSIAEELAAKGADVTLVCGPNNLETHNSKIKRIDVVSAKEMHQACMNAFNDTDITVMAAAVADYSPKEQYNFKFVKSDKTFAIKLVPTKDILFEMGNKRRSDQLLVGFALESSGEIESAKNKLHKKNLDFIVLNSLNDKGAGFGNTTNKITIIDKNNQITAFELKEKREVAKDIVGKIIEYFK